jgi:crotonobetainyl-CoA:carnitine CoA-transferase CaiB-like acyl-CoA transferase
MGTSGHPNIAPYQVYPAQDGHIVLAVGNDAQFRRFCAAVGQPEFAADPAFSTIRARVGNRIELNRRIEAITRTRSMADWVAALEAVQVPCGEINTLDRVFSDPHVVARGMRVDIEHPQYGSVPSIRSPIRFSETPLDFTVAPPVLGQHTNQVLRGLGLSDDVIASLHQEKIV